jgi:peptidoglycan hydrolase-like protein with peptidoglycan-binding domain
MVGLHYAGTSNVASAGFNFGKRLSEIVKDSRILAAVAADQRREDERPAALAAAARAEIEARVRAEAEAAARAEIDRRVREQLDAERARVAALPPATAPAAPAGVDPSADWAAAETALGLTTDRVRALQGWLEALGHDPRGIDGRLGTGTRNALRSYQKTKGLAETGFVSAELATLLSREGGEAVRKRDEARAALAAARPPAPVSPSSPVRPAVGIWPSPLVVAPPVSRRIGEVFRDCEDCPELVVVPSGATRLASGRDVTIAAPFAVGRFEVTFAEWDICVSDGGCAHRPGDQGWGRGRQPVMNVNWDDAQSYVVWLSRKTGRSYRLLSEAEWEYAAQAGSGGEQAAQAGSNQANCVGCGSRWDNRQTSPVGSFAPNAFGLHDMLGNVWEWTGDCWNDSHAGASGDGTARTGGDCSRRVLRGGSWFSDPWSARSATRDGSTSASASSTSASVWRGPFSPPASLSLCLLRGSPRGHGPLGGCREMRDSGQRPRDVRSRQLFQPCRRAVASSCALPRLVGRDRRNKILGLWNMAIRI